MVTIQDLLTKSSDVTFYIKSLGEKAKKASNDYLKMIEMFDDIPNIISEINQTDTLTVEQLTEIENTLFTKYGVQTPNNLVTVCGHNVRLIDAVDALIWNQADSINLAGTDLDPGNTITDKVTVIKRAMNGDVLGTFDTTEADLGADLQANYHSIVAFQSACDAYFDQASGKVNDVLTNYNDRMADVFKDEHVDLSSTSTFFKNLLRTCPEPGEFLSNIITACGMADANNTSDQTEFDYYDTPMGEYTGTNIMIPFNFSWGNPFDAFISANKFCVWLTYKTFEGLWEGIKWVGKKVFGFVEKKTWNPEDIKETNSKGNHTIDKFQYQQRFVNSSMNFETEAEAIAAREEMYNNEGKWIFSEDLFSEKAYLIEIVDEVNYDSATQSYVFDVTYKFCMKPKIINIDIARQIRLLRGSGSPSLDQFCQDLSGIGSSLYDLTDLSEGKIFEGLLTSLILECQICRLAFRISQNQLQDFTAGTEYINHDGVDCYFDDHQVNNLDFVCLACGWNDYSDTFDTDPTDYIASHFNLTAVGVTAMWGTVRDVSLAGWQWMWCFIHNVTNLNVAYTSNNAGCFIPYTKERTGFSAPSYEIKTDAENQSAANQFFLIAIIVVAVIALGVAIGLSIRNNRRKKYLEWTATVGRLDNKMWNGGILTDDERKIYLKAQRKLARLDLFSSSLVGSGVNIPTPSPSDSYTAGEQLIMTRIG